MYFLMWLVNILLKIFASRFIKDIGQQLSFLFVVRILKIYSRRDFQMYNRVLLITSTMLYITSQDLPDNWTFVPFGHLHPFHLSLFSIHPHHLWQPPVCSLYRWVMFVCVCLFVLTPHGIEIIWYLSLSVWLISLSIMPSSSKSFHGFLNICYMIISICSYFSFYTYIALLLTFLHLRH